MEPSTTSPAESRGPGKPSWRANDPASLSIPVLDNAQALLLKGEYGRAVSESYHRVVLDLQKAYGLSLPAQWTHREFLSDFLREDMGVVTTRVAGLYRLYEPVRYGTETDWARGDLLDLLHQIYEEPSMRNLYVGRPGSPARTKLPGDDPPPAAPGGEGSAGPVR